MLLPPASEPPPPPRPHSTLAMWALGLGLSAVVAAGSVLLALFTGPRLTAPASRVIDFGLLVVPAIALAALVVGIVATVRTSRLGQRVWMAVTGLVLGVVMLAIWPGVFLSVVIAYMLSSLGG